MNNDELLPWVDIETFGLNHQNDPIIEIGIIITDLDLNVIHQTSALIWSPMHDHALDKLTVKAERGNEDAKYVLKMHSTNGLFDDAVENGQSMDSVENDLTNLVLNSWQLPKLPMCGSSVHFDQRFLMEQMPKIYNLFHYRIIDNSSLKELCRRYNPRIFAKAPEKIQEDHRVLPDLEDTINEFRFYRDEFLLW